MLVIGELHLGMEQVRRRDPAGASALTQWLARVTGGYANRILSVNTPVAEPWGRLNVPDPLPVIDGLLVATAIVHELTLVTRNVADVENTGVDTLNPFTGGQDSATTG